MHLLQDPHIYHIQYFYLLHLSNLYSLLYLLFLYTFNYPFKSSIYLIIYKFLILHIASLVLLVII